MKKWSPNKTLHYYAAVKLHFSSDQYNCFQFNFKLKNIQYEKRKDKTFLQKLSCQSDPASLILSNLSNNPGLWVGDLFSPQAQEIYWKWKKYQEAQIYWFTEELKLLDSQSFQVIEGQHPKVLRMYLGGKISLDTITILNDFVRFTDTWKLDDIIWPNIKFRILKYRPFISYDRYKIHSILKNFLLT